MLPRLKQGDAFFAVIMALLKEYKTRMLVKRFHSGNTVGHHKKTRS
jgi:hypothetical protein